LDELYEPSPPDSAAAPTQRHNRNLLSAPLAKRPAAGAYRFAISESVAGSPQPATGLRTSTAWRHGPPAGFADSPSPMPKRAEGRLPYGRWEHCGAAGVTTRPPVATNVLIGPARPVRRGGGTARDRQLVRSMPASRRWLLRISIGHKEQWKHSDAYRRKDNTRLSLETASSASHTHNELSTWAIRQFQQQKSKNLTDRKWNAMG